MNEIRNFCIIAHIDHGKSTLADRLLEYTKTIQITEGQMLDDMELERERGITIKSHAIQMEYDYGGSRYILNLIDTPGHVDFSYEVSRSIAACEGALLVVDATQGVQAQTISNLYMALDQDLEIIPVINKIDMPSAMPDEVEDEIVDLIGCDRKDIIRASGKTGEGVSDILDAVVERIPHPAGLRSQLRESLVLICWHSTCMKQQGNIWLTRRFANTTDQKSLISRRTSTFFAIPGAHPSLPRICSKIAGKMWNSF